ncbi:hypothetical protein FPANT_8893 [Fusarium pseudoanthophilum]|uniref:Uncharacterized protein n=1 Tax=Fusarium pseudoanthophilum TaxID=48495 RepID=A0A8H5KVS1_9HYPO|nr:hypothetical protein FPANT_8893 [Fusarium pseudoanthophilum]
MSLGPFESYVHELKSGHPQFQNQAAVCSSFPPFLSPPGFQARSKFKIYPQNKLLFTLQREKMSQPALYSAPRRFGRYEPFLRFDHLSSGHASVGSKCVGKMSVDCRFLFKKSRWGVLGESQFPAGILYLDLNFGPPQGCKVKTATVTVTLDDSDECLRSLMSDDRDLYHDSNCSLEMTGCFGPQSILGEEKSTEFKRTMRMTPEVQAMGFGVGGIGGESERSFKGSSRWTFMGQVLAGKRPSSYKTLKWYLTDNELESQAFRSSCVHTAFAFQHSGKPFLMRVDIQGRLEKWNHRIKNKLKFGTGLNPSEGQTATLINFKQWKSYDLPLDEYAQQLPERMWMENYESTPIQMPDTREASFNQANGALGPEEAQSQKETFDAGEPIDAFKTSPPPTESRPTPPVGDTELQQVMDCLSRPPQIQTAHRAPQDCSQSSSDTLVADEESSDNLSAVKIMKGQVTPSAPQADLEAIQRLLQVPAILALLQLLSSILDTFAPPRKRDVN